MAFANWLWAAVAARFDLTFGAAAPYGAPALAGALACSLAYYLWRRRSRGRPVSAAASSAPSSPAGSSGTRRRSST